MFEIILILGGLGVIVPGGAIYKPQAFLKGELVLHDR